MKCLLRRRHSQQFLVRQIQLTHPVSRRKNKVQGLDMKYPEFDCVWDKKKDNLCFVITNDQVVSDPHTWKYDFLDQNLAR